MKRAATARTRELSSGSSTSQNCSRSHRAKKSEAALGLDGGLAGADFLPAARALVGLQHLLAQADGLRRDFHVLIIGEALGGFLQHQFSVRNQAPYFVRACRAHA